MFEDSHFCKYGNLKVFENFGSVNTDSSNIYVKVRRPKMDTFLCDLMLNKKLWESELDLKYFW